MKKKQFCILMCELNQLEEKDGKLYLNWSQENFQITSESFLIRQIQSISKFFGHTIDILNNIEKVNLISIETGKVTPGNKDKLAKLLHEGFYIQDYNYKLIQLLGGSHHKQIKQFYTYTKILDKLQPRIDLKPLTHTIRSKRLTSNALLSTDIYTIPYNLKDLDICILPDHELTLELPILKGIIPHANTPEEDIKLKNKNELDAEIKLMFEKYHETKENIDYSKLQLVDDFDKYRTPSRWLEDHRLIMEEEIAVPLYYSVSKKDDDKYIVYAENQTVKADEELFKVAEWSTGYELKNINSIEVNNFDGMGIISKELGSFLEQHLQLRNITGYQLRLPQIKGFFPVVNIHSYFKEHGIKVIYDIFGQSHNTSKIDILACESTFKAKLNTSTGKKQWIWKSIEEYKDALVKHKYDCIGVANYTHKLNKNEYRPITYQLLSSLKKLSEYELLALATPQGEMIANVLNIYTRPVIDWQDIKYVQIYLNNILDSKENDNDDYIETAIKMLTLNKYMIYDNKFTNYLFNKIQAELEQMALGRIKVHSNYTFTTGDILGFLKYASKFSNEICKDKAYREKIAAEKIEGYLKENEFYMSGTIGEKVLVRNPMMAESEVEKATFINIEDSDVKYIKHIDNIIQSPMNTSIFQQMGGYDVDGDELMLMHLDYDLQSSSIDWLISYNFEDKITDLKQEFQVYFNQKYKDKCIVTFQNLISSNQFIQVNINDKAGEEGSEWNIDNIAEFILSSNDRTGEITDINTTALNEINHIHSQQSSGQITEYKAIELLEPLMLTNQIMKHKQGEMIDASKTGVEVIIPDVIIKKYKKRPYFYKYKGKDFKKVYDIQSSLDKFCRKMEGLINYINKNLTNNIRNRVKSLEVTNLSSYIFNDSIPYSACEPYINLLQNLQREYSNKKQQLIEEKKKINMYSKNDDAKQARLENKKQWSNLIKTVRDKAKDICPDDEIRGNTAIYMTYNKSKNYDFAWVIASDVFLKRLENNKTESYVVSRYKDGDIEYLGKKYKLEIKNIEDTSTKNTVVDNTKLEGYQVVVCVYASDPEIKRQALQKLKDRILCNLYLVEEDGFIKLSIDGINLGVNKQYYAKGNLQQRIGQRVQIEDIYKTTPKSINMSVNINCQ